MFFSSRIQTPARKSARLRTPGDQFDTKPKEPSVFPAVPLFSMSTIGNPTPHRRYFSPSLEDNAGKDIQDPFL